MTVPSSFVKFETCDDVGVVTLARPHTLNAMSLELVRDINLALDQVAATHAVRCVILTGEGRAFSAGGDLSVHRNLASHLPAHDLGKALEQYFNPLLLRLLAIPVPLVIAVNGAAAGAGCPLALCGDFVLAAESAFFQCGFARIGLGPDLGSSWLIPRLIGRAMAHGMMMLDDRVSASRAIQLGMIYRCVPDSDLMPAARDIAKRLACGPPKALVAARRLILEGYSTSLPESLLNEARVQTQLSRSDDFAEGIAAFFAKRSPKFRGS
jgi:2-(1,2-epoxy-1,2-dihydrophenyl)acetyl-CoA isomerase